MQSKSANAQTLDTFSRGGSGDKGTNPATAGLCSRFRPGTKWGQTGDRVGTKYKRKIERDHSLYFQTYLPSRPLPSCAAVCTLPAPLPALLLGEILARSYPRYAQPPALPIFFNEIKGLRSDSPKLLSSPQNTITLHNGHRIKNYTISLFMYAIR
jgi:hypothetical protein